MGVPNQFNDIIQNHLNIFAAWVPIVNKYTLGDYGILPMGYLVSSVILKTISR